MAIQNFPIQTILPTAGLIANVPSGPVTAIDVQSAINQLAALIPAVGPGTDPLFLSGGLSVNTNNPTASGDANLRWATRLRVTTDNAQNNPLFGNNEVLDIQMIATNGQATNGAQTQAKTTFLPLNLGATYNASGQKFLTNNFIVSYGMSDTALGQEFVQYSGGPVNGDEGQGFRLVSSLKQQDYLNFTHITAKPAQSTVNTTTTQVINKSKDAQTVTVVSTAGVTDGDWVVIEQELPSGAPNLEAVQVIAHSATSITGIFLYNHASGVTVTPALRLFCESTFQMGQDRVLVNLSYATPVTAGTVTAITGGALTGSGTAWATNMVGGNATNIGAIALTADDDSLSPFNGSGVNGTLKHWYQIAGVSGPTGLGVHSFSVAGDGSYHGAGPGPSGTGTGPSAYVIRPCARVLRIVASFGSVTGEIICETVANPADWKVNDNVEQAICPYADVNGFYYRILHYTRGGAGVRTFMDIRNSGHRTIGACFNIQDDGSHAANPSWDTIINLAASCSIGINFASSGGFSATQAALRFSSKRAGGSATDESGTLIWDSTGTYFGPISGNAGLAINPILGDNGGFAPTLPIDHTLQWYGANLTGAPSAGSALAFMSWAGHFYLPQTGTSGQRPSFLIDWVTDLVNFERGFMRWETGGGVLAIGTEKGGTGGQHDMILKADNVEILRFDSSGHKVQFSAAGNFAANGSVATVLGSVGPAGASTTVQTWLTFKDSGGNTRYVPCF